MKAIVHGTRLIGSSVGLALAVQGWEVAGWDPQGCRRGAGQHHQIDLIQAIAGPIEGSGNGSEPLRHLQGLWISSPP